MRVLAPIVIAVITVVCGLPAPAAADAPVYSCHALGAQSKVAVVFQKGYTAQDVAHWWLGSTCARVIVESVLLARPSSKGYKRTVRGDQLRVALDALLAGLDMVAIVEGPSTIFVDKNTLSKPGPELVITRFGRRRPPPAARPSPVDREDLKKHIASIRKKSAGHTIVPRAVVDFVLARPMAVGRGARIVPSIKNGKANGFKLYAIRPSSIYAAVGFRNGDTIHSINGLDLTTPDRALEVYTSLRNASKLVFKITRRGKPFRLRIDIRGS